MWKKKQKRKLLRKLNIFGCLNKILCLIYVISIEDLLFRGQGHKPENTRKKRKKITKDEKNE